MVTTVRSRPSHYEVLGLTPTATVEEIAQAFVRRMSLFRARPLADVAQVTSAYETLRNPEKRREYDSVAGPKPGPKLEPEKLGWSFALAQPAWKPFIASVPTGPMGASLPPKRRALRSLTLQRSRTRRPPPIRGSSPLRHRFGNWRSPVSATQQPHRRRRRFRTGASGGRVELTLDPGPKQRRPEHKSDAGVEQLIQHIRIAGRAEKESSMIPRGPGWSGSGRCSLRVGLSWASRPARRHCRDIGRRRRAGQRDRRRSRTETSSECRIASRGCEPSGSTDGADGASSGRSRAHSSCAFAPEASLCRNELVELSPAVASTAAVAADTPGGACLCRGGAASLPLPSNVIARTIDRIGYPCGSVDLATALDGQGAFKITCSWANPTRQRRSADIIASAAGAGTSASGSERAAEGLSAPEVFTLIAISVNKNSTASHAPGGWAHSRGSHVEKRRCV